MAAEDPPNDHLPMGEGLPDRGSLFGLSGPQPLAPLGAPVPPLWLLRKVFEVSTMAFKVAVLHLRS